MDITNRKLDLESEMIFGHNFYKTKHIEETQLINITKSLLAYKIR